MSVSPLEWKDWAYRAFTDPRFPDPAAWGDVADRVRAGERPDPEHWGAVSDLLFRHGVEERADEELAVSAAGILEEAVTTTIGNDSSGFWRDVRDKSRSAIAGYLAKALSRRLENERLHKQRTVPLGKLRRGRGHKPEDEGDEDDSGESGTSIGAVENDPIESLHWAAIWKRFDAAAQQAGPTYAMHWVLLSERYGEDVPMVLGSGRTFGNDPVPEDWVTPPDKPNVRNWMSKVCCGSEGNWNQHNTRLRRAFRALRASLGYYQ